MQKLKLILASLLLFSSLFGDEIYFLPKQSHEIEQVILNNIKKAKSSIDVAMYNFKYRKFAKALDDAAKRGVEVKVYYYKKKVKFTNGVKPLKVRKKLHTKIALFDKKTAIFGSANWTKDSFKKNYEVIFITKKDKIIHKIDNFFKTIKR